ncbi:deoxyribose-phosphate aldolase [Ascidiimonas sp. W6]|uniref:deoxyribose-phosphate aldolase n=1 Tax=Ascidiimonas meishanensis TaxID=3128903 RepID=UPI0030EC3804
MKVNSYIDHTFLKPFATEKDVLQLCKEAKKHEFFSICINSCYVLFAKEQLSESEIAVCSVVGFPLGAMQSKAKIYETELAIKHGAAEIDTVLNVGYLKDGKYQDLKKELIQMKQLLGSNVLKVIIENCYLTDEEKRIACDLCVEAGADFVKTSTGFGSGGATLADIRLMKKALQGQAKIKASGGIRDFNTAQLLIKNGADRLGTSNSVEIVTFSG